MLRKTNLGVRGLLQLHKVLDEQVPMNAWIAYSGLACVDGHPSFIGSLLQSRMRSVSVNLLTSAQKCHKMVCKDLEQSRSGTGFLLSQNKVVPAYRKCAPAK